MPVRIKSTRNFRQFLDVRPRDISAWIDRVDAPEWHSGGHMQDRSIDAPEWHSVSSDIAYVQKSRPVSGLGFQVKVLKNCQGVPSSLGGGLVRGAFSQNDASKPIRRSEMRIAG